MTHTIENIRGKKIAVRCKTKNEAIRLLKAVDYFHRYNYSSRIVNFWSDEKSKTCYILNAAGADGIAICSLKNISSTYEVIQCSDIVTDALIREIDLWHLRGKMERNSRTIEELTEQLNEAKEWQETYTAQLALLHGDL